MYDLVVVGAGPVGSYLSWKFAERGKDVLILERGEVGEPLRCSGHISKDLFNFIPYNGGLVENEIRGAVFHNNGKKYSVEQDETISYVIDRTKLDKFLLEKAKESGAKLRKESFENMRAGDSSVLVNTDSGSYESKLLVGCDGPLSDVRKQSGLPDPKEFLHGIFTYSSSQGKFEDEDFVDVFLGTTDDFFGWRIPRKGKVEYGLATSLKGNVKKEFERFSEKRGFETNNVYSGLIPLLPPKKTSARRVFLCGDAAAQTKPFTGGGVIYGLISASIASKIIDPERPGTIRKYEKGWRRKLGREIWLGKWIRKFYGLPDKLRTPFLNIGTKISGNMHMDRPSSLFRM